MKRLSLIFLLLVCYSVGSSFAQNAPISSVGDAWCYEEEIIIPITAIDFNNIGSCNLQLLYDPTVASATAVTIGPGIGGSISVNIVTPGVIRFGWYKYPAANAPDSAPIFNIAFTRVSFGSTAITFDPDYTDREWTNGNYVALNDLPFENYYFNGSLTYLTDAAPSITLADAAACAGTTAQIPVTVNGFNNIGAFTLTIHYDPSNISYQTFSANSMFPGILVNMTSPGVLMAEASSMLSGGISLPDNTTLFTIHFSVMGGPTDLSWFDDGATCQFNGPAPNYFVLNDIPQTNFYYDGSVSELPLPGDAGEISGPAGGIVCQGQTDVIFSIYPVAKATAYNWYLPPGASITAGNGTNNITVAFDDNALGGELSVFAENDCGAGLNSPPFTLILNSLPEIIQQPLTPDTVNAGAGTASFEVIASGTNLSYRWQEFITSWEDVSNSDLYSGSNTAVLVITNPPASMDGFKYRCIVSGSCEPAAITDGMATLHVNMITSDFSRKHPNGSALSFSANPNPFSDQTTLSLNIIEPGDIHIVIYNLAGEVIISEISYDIPAGKFYFKVSQAELKSGLYLARLTLTANNKVLTGTTKLICNKQ